MQGYNNIKYVYRRFHSPTLAIPCATSATHFSPLPPPPRPLLRCDADSDVTRDDSDNESASSFASAASAAAVSAADIVCCRADIDTIDALRETETLSHYHISTQCMPVANSKHHMSSYTNAIAFR